MIGVSAKPVNPVWISGVGAVSCLGGSMRDLWSAVEDSRSGIEDGLGVVADSSLVAPIDEVRRNRALAFCKQAVAEAMAQAGWTSIHPDDGLIFATTTGQLQLWDSVFMGLSRGEKTASELRQAFVHQPLGTLMSALAQEIGHSGPSTLLTSACSASTQALGVAAMWIKQGRVKRCLVVGAEVLCDLTTEGFRSLKLLAPDRAKPFDRERSGINLSEGAAALCLEAKCARPLARLSGFGFTTDGYHMTGPHPEGDGCYRAMRMALQSAGVSAYAVTWVHAHGTGSQLNDMAEGLAVRRLFGESTPFVSSTKWLHGHALAASGALETALVVECIRHAMVLSTRGLQNADEKIPVRHPMADLNIKLRHVLKSTLGFGGTNAAILISHPEERT